MPGQMSRQRFNEQMSVSSALSTVRKAAAYTLKVHETQLYADISGGSLVFTLPRVDEAQGNTYWFEIAAAAAAGAAPNTATIRDQKDSKAYPGPMVLRRKGQYAWARSNGEAWEIGGSGGGLVFPRKYFHEQFTTCPMYATKAGGAHSATAENVMACGSGMRFSYQGIVGQTLTPAWLDPGLDIAGDQVSGDGYEFTTGLGTGNLFQWVIGTDPGFFCRARFTIVDVTGLSECAVGFRIRAAYQAAIDNYTDGAFFNVQAGVINIETMLNNAATTTTATTLTDWADTATHTLEVRVSAAGVVSYLYDDAVPTVVPAAFTFDAGDAVIPFIHLLQAADLSGAVSLLEWEVGNQ